MRVRLFSLLCLPLLLTLPAEGAAQTSMDASGMGSVIVGYDSRACDSSIEGAMRFNDNVVTGCTISNGDATEIADGSIQWSPADFAFYGDHAFVLGTWNSVTAFNVSDPTSPVQTDVVSSSALGNSFKMAISEDGNYLFVPVQSNNSVQIIDISNPSDISIVNSFSSSTYLDGAVSADVQGNYLYVVSYVSNNIIAVDISNPLTTSLSDMVDSIDLFSGNAGDISIVGNYAYIALIEHGMTIVDISDPSNLVNRGSLSIVDRRHENIVAAGNYAYVTANTDSGGSGTDYFAVVDVSDPDTPVEVGSLSTGVGGAYDVVLAGNYAFVAADDEGGAVIIDISNPTAPSIVDTLTSTNLGTDADSIGRDGRYLYVGDWGDSTFVIFDLGCDPGASGAAIEYCNATSWTRWGQ